MRTYKTSKTRQGKPKITLYENGQVMLCRPVTTNSSTERTPHDHVC